MTGDDLNLEAYTIMAEILVTVRRIVHRGLEKAAGKTWYLDGCPSGVYERLVARKENEVAIDRFDREYQELISFASLDDLAEIVEYNQDLAHLLESIEPEGETMAERFRQIETIRLKLAAAVPFDDEDMEALVGYHADFRKSLSKPKQKAEPVEVPDLPPAADDVEELAPEQVVVEEGEPFAAPPPESGEFSTRVADMEELSAEDVIADDPADDFGTAVVDSDVPAEDEIPVQDESALEAERAMASDDDQEVLRVLHSEVMSVAEAAFTGQLDREFPVWRTLEKSGWYAIKKGSLELGPIEEFYLIAEEARVRARAGTAQDEIKTYLDEAELSNILLALREMFMQQGL